MKYHPISNIWPLMNDAEIAELASDIKENGLRYPISIYEGMILDGRNRWLACAKAKVNPRTEQYTGDEPVRYAASLNNHRRHLGTAARAAVAAEALPFLEEEAKKRQIRKPAGSVPAKLPGQNEHLARDDAAKAYNVSPRYVQDAKRVKEEAPALFEKMKAGKISMQDAQRELRKRPTSEWTEDEKKRKAMVADGETVIANYEKDKNLIAWAESKKLAVPIDRGSPFGNPFVLNADGDRDTVCNSYEKYYLPHKPSIKSKLPTLSGKVLCCHCYPERCHGESLIRAAKNK